MALRGLVEGECGAANPLVQWSSHFHQQKSLAQGGLGGDRLQELSRHGEQRDLENELVEEFVGESRPAVPQTFNMASLLTEIQHPHTLTPSPLTHDTRQDSSVREWVDEFASPSSHLTHHHSQPQAVADTWTQEFVSSETEALDWSQQFHVQAEDEKWAEEFRDQVESNGLAAVATELSESVTDPKIQATEFMQFVRKLGKGEVTADGVEVKGEAEGEKWAEEFRGEREGEVEDVGYWGQLEREWEELAKQNTHPWLDDFAEFSEEQRAYKFQEQNHLKDVENALEEGKRRLREGDLPSAVLLFEAEVQKNPDSVEGWQYLGTTQANNEQELAAIAALHRCLELCPSNLQAHLSLAVSYTNEAQQKRALESLRHWLYHNEKYHHLIPESSVTGTPASKPFIPSLMTSEEHRSVCELFLKAAQCSPDQLDPDIQVCLGVLYNLSNEFDKAVDCFSAALHARPDDALLWNKLGATLANSSRSEEAVHAYRQALSHMPGFTRCRYNLGISCINLKAYQEAVEHFLTALNHQRQAQGCAGQEVGVAGVGVATHMSETVWSTLRLAVTFLGRSSLIPMLEARNLDGLLAEFGLVGKPM